MKDARTGKAARTMAATDWRRRRGRPVAELAPIEAGFRRGAERVMPRRQEPVTLRLDADRQAGPVADMTGWPQ